MEVGQQSSWCLEVTRSSEFKLLTAPASDSYESQVSPYRSRRSAAVGFQVTNFPLKVPSWGPASDIVLMVGVRWGVGEKGAWTSPWTCISLFLSPKA